MKKHLTLTVSLVFLLTMAAAVTAPCQMLNAYEPHNALAAEPYTPYNLNQIPQISRTFYLPCPSWGPFANQLPDAPPFYCPIMGPFGLPVSQP